MNVSIIIPTYNKLPRLKLTLASLQNQTYPVNKFEVVIVDNGSTDGTTEFLKEVEMPYKCVFMGNMGRAAGRNRGLEHADNELIIFIDDDLILDPLFIEEHVNLQSQDLRILHGRIMNLPFLKFFQDPTNGVLYNNISNQSKSETELKKKCISERDIMYNFERVVTSNSRMTAFEFVIKEILRKDASKAGWIGFTGGNTSVPKKWLNSVGGYDENFGLDWGCEDLELGYRLQLEECEFFYAENAVNYHMAHYRANYENEHSKTTDYFFNKHKNIKILYLQEFISGKIKKDNLIDYMLA